MKKKENFENNESDSEEEVFDEGEFQLKNRKKKFNLTKEEIKEKYNSYLNCKLKYPKSQFCYFYFKGTCLLGNKCQFCHGYEEFSMDRFLTFLEDKNAVEKSSQKFYQKFYFNQIISPNEYTYDNLLEYQEKHPELFKKKFTFEELKKSRKKRLKIRFLLTREIIEKFLVELFNRFNCIKIDQLIYYIYNVGYPQSIKQLIRETKTCYAKNIKDGNKTITYFIKNLKPEEMINIFAKIIIEHMKGGKFENFFPINFSHISKIIFTNTKINEPNITTYIHQTNCSENNFMDILIQKLIEESNKGNFDLIKNKTKDDLIKDPYSLKNINNIYNDHFKLNNTKFSYFNIDDIEKNLNINIVKNTDKYKLKFLLFNDGNLFFSGNENELYALNYYKFQSFNIDEFYNNTFYFKNCGEQNNILLENEIKNININSSNNTNEQNIILDEKNIYNIQNTIINFIDDEKSLNYFKSKSKNFEVLSIDIEGSFNIENIRINLIQICDDTNLKNDIYVIDFNTFKLMKNETFIELSKLLKDIFENKNIKKIFFDGRSDLLSLHKELNICVKNFIDLSSLYNAVNSYRDQNTFKYKKEEIEKSEKNLSQCIKSCKQKYFLKGLNKVLQSYHSNHCINPLKDKYHKIFKQEPFEYWTKRPIIEEFLLYSALDVKYEYDTYNNLKKELKKILINFYKLDDICENNIDLVILLISSGNHNIACNSYKKLKNDLLLNQK